MGGKTREACDASVVHLAKLGQAGDQDGGEGGAYAGNGGEAAPVLGEGRTGAVRNTGGDLPLYGLQVRLQDFEQPRRFPAPSKGCDRVGRGFSLVPNTGHKGGRSRRGAEGHPPSFVQRQREHPPRRLRVPCPRRRRTPLSPPSDPSV